MTRISSEDVQATAEAFDTAVSTEKRPLLVHLGALTQITPEARQMLIKGTHSTRIAVFSEDLVTKVVTAFAYAAVVPTRFFTDETEATDWLLDPHPTTNSL